MVHSDDGGFPSNTVFEEFEAGVFFYAGFWRTASLYPPLISLKHSK